MKRKPTILLSRDERHAVEICLNREGMSQAELAREMGVERALISMWLSGKTPIPLRQLVKMARILRTDSSVIVYPREEAPVEINQQ